MRYNTNYDRCVSDHEASERPVPIEHEITDVTPISCYPLREENDETKNHNKGKEDKVNSRNVEDRLGVLFGMIDKVNKQIDDLTKEIQEVKNRNDTMYNDLIQ